MAGRPWVTPGDVKEYTDNPLVQARSDGKLATDVLAAEEWVISHTNNRFAGTEPIPQAVRTAVILIAEQYAIRAVENGTAGVQGEGGTVKSETFDDYSYTLADPASAGLDWNAVYALLEAYRQDDPKYGVELRLRKL